MPASKIRWHISTTKSFPTSLTATSSFLTGSNNSNHFSGTLQFVHFALLINAA